MLPGSCQDILPAQPCKQGFEAALNNNSWGLGIRLLESWPGAHRLLGFTTGAHNSLAYKHLLSEVSFLKPKLPPLTGFLFQLDNLTLMEINSSGAFLTQALNHMYKLRTNLQPPESTQTYSLT